MPICTKDNVPGEIVIPSDVWGGYFRGVKSSYVFFDPDDGYNGTTQFGVFDARTGKKLFEDAAEGGDDKIRSIEVLGTALRFRYRRAYVAPCSILKEGQKCWEAIKSTVTTKPVAMPDCASQFQ